MGFSRMARITSSFPDHPPVENVQPVRSNPQSGHCQSERAWANHPAGSSAGQVRRGARSSSSGYPSLSIGFSLKGFGDDGLNLVSAQTTTMLDEVILPDLVERQTETDDLVTSTNQVVVVPLGFGEPMVGRSVLG